MNKKLKEARKENGITQEEMAKILGYSSKSGYSMIETGRNSPPLHIAIKIAEILKKDVSYLFGTK